MFRPITVLLEFLTWFAWLACFAAVQSKFCQQYPTMRARCRRTYMCTMVLPVLASLWFMAHAETGTDMFAVLNHAFGAGVFAQTFVRAIVLLKTLAITGIPHHAVVPGYGPTNVLHAEGDLVALLGVLSQTMGRPVPQLRRGPLAAARKSGD